MTHCHTSSCGASHPRANPLPVPLATVGGAMLSGTGLGLGFKVAEVVATPVLEAVRARLGTRSQQSQNDGPAAWQRLADDVTQEEEVVVPMSRQSNPSESRFEPGEVVRVKSLGDQPGRVVSIARRPARKRGLSALFGGGGGTKYHVVTVSGAPVVAEEGQLRRFNPDTTEPAEGELPARIEDETVIVRLGIDAWGEPVDASMPFAALDDLDEADAQADDDSDSDGVGDTDEANEADDAVEDDEDDASEPSPATGELVTVSNPEGAPVVVGLLGLLVGWGLVERACEVRAARQSAGVLQAVPAEPTPRPAAVGPQVWSFR